MKTKSILSILVIVAALPALNNDTFAQGVLPPFNLHVPSTGCSGDAGSNGYVKISYTYQGSTVVEERNQLTNGWAYFTVPVGNVYVYVSYNGNYGEFCSEYQDENGENFYACLTNTSCCIPKANQNLFGCALDMNN